MVARCGVPISAGSAGALASGYAPGGAAGVGEQAVGAVVISRDEARYTKWLLASLYRYPIPSILRMNKDGK